MPQSLGRITRSDEFSDILRNGSRTIASGVVMMVCASGVGPRLGFAVGSKAGNAVQRNRFRRVVREFLRRKVLPAVDMVISVRAPIQKMTNNDVRNALTALSKKNGWSAWRS